ncbi:T9SS C-terminal target domain-containing protein [Leeuwenhoekiella marinoflava]|uniref:Pectate lyase n=2 Tax=Leeuwenhoekiella marinoflava TaxID=988 RepID=A0A4Q0PNQ5_9FLAO|nr:T9SS C-terminal target domain-containing protein [Leeuwenhoekiella marinoflava]RXG32206.1 hypothetical protein DSL99_1012 [Leeuwenhoekiella marinoflava]SHE83400.1 hypothetical protein SAMN02745246_01147 [Leeuwenhoekiella marinoflava DSM 3653]
MKPIIWSKILLMLLAVNAASCQVQETKSVKQPVKIDLDFGGRKVLEVNDPNYKSWMINEGESSEFTTDSLSFRLKGALNSSWYKTGIQAPYYARLISDGVRSSDGIDLEIKGLKAGEHSFLGFHNTFDKLEGEKTTALSIAVNGKPVTSVEPSNRAEKSIDAAVSYFKFNAQKGEPVVIHFDIIQENGNLQKLVLNGFEIDTPNLKKQAANAYPEDNDEHVVISDDFKLKWDSPEGTEKSLIYFGADLDEIKSANQSSDSYQGEILTNTFSVPELYSRNTYYWRVDTVDDEGEITPGKVWYFKPAQLAFKGAEGYGRFAIGGRGGIVAEVTNLNDSGPGSLRYAVEELKGPRTIVFNISGIIELESRLVVSDPYVTIAGQTAPGKGILIANAPIGLTGNDGIIRFLNVAIGAGRTYDGMGLTGADHSIIDHSSIRWTIDESFSSRGAHNITLQNTLIAEALNVANHGKYENGKMHGYAATIGGDIGSFHHNLLAHNYGRNWSMGGGLNGEGYYSGRLDIRNNVVYNWGHRTTDGGAKEVNFVNNYYKPGVASDIFYALTADHEGVGKGSQRYYFTGNVMPGHFEENNQEKGRRSRITNNEVVDYETFVDKPFFPSYVKTQTAKEAYKTVLSDVGANQPRLDDHDKRIIQETLNGTFKYTGSKSGIAGHIDTEDDTAGWEDYPVITRPDSWDTDHDGLPDWWEKLKGLNPKSSKNDFSDTNLDENQDGFTELENYLEWLAKPHFVIKEGDTLSFSVKEYFEGFTASPVYSVKAITNGSAKIEEESLEFNSKGKGFASFTISVKDKDGDTMDRLVNVLIQ